MNFGFIQSIADHCLFTKGTESSFMTLLVYVDDVLIVGPDKGVIQNVKRFLNQQFTIKDLGYIRYFLGLELARSPSGMFLHQQKYVMDLLKDVGLINTKSVSTPMFRNAKFSSEEGDLITNLDSYRRLIGRLLYLGLARPDITFSVQ